MLTDKINSTISFFPQNITLDNPYNKSVTECWFLRNLMEKIKNILWKNINASTSFK